MTSLNEHAARMAVAVWNDLTAKGEGRIKTGDDGYHFRYAGREYRMARVTGDGWFIDLVGPTGNTPFTSGAEWTGRRRKDAVRAMVTATYGHPCPHSTNTGRDGCSGCDAYDNYDSDH